MDCSGLRTLLRANQLARENSHQHLRLRLRQGPRQIERIFDLTGTAALFSFEDVNTPNSRLPPRS